MKRKRMVEIFSYVLASRICFHVIFRNKVSAFDEHSQEVRGINVTNFEYSVNLCGHQVVPSFTVKCRGLLSK